MKTTVDIPENELKDAMRFTKAKTKREAVVRVLEEFNRRRRMAELIRYSGTWCDRPAGRPVDFRVLEGARTRSRPR
jgi:hypothetical protein